MMRPRILLAAAAGALALSAATPAWAYWTNTGTGTATATADALGTPPITATGVLLTLIATFNGHTGGGGTVNATGFTAYAGASAMTTTICTSSSPNGSCSGLTLALINAVFNIRYTLTGSPWYSLTPEVCTFNTLGTSATCLPN
jgi:hypothetical protein